jgi:hypothetical protein
MTEYPDTPNRQPKKTSKNPYQKLFANWGGWKLVGSRKQIQFIFVNRVFRRATANPTNCSGLQKDTTLNKTHHIWQDLQ